MQRTVVPILLCLCAAVLGAAGLASPGAAGAALGKAIGGALETAGNLLPTDDFSKIQFILQTNATNASYPIANATQLLADPSFDASKPTVLYMHGYQESIDSESVGVVSQAFIRRGSHNFVVLDWSPYVGAPYTTAFLNVPGAGAAVGEAVNRLVAAGLSRDALWPIGHSLGGQLAGVVADNLDFKLNRITALDPAGPGFGLPGTPELSGDDAVLVDVIHTDGGVFGFGSDDGTLDIWPNGGRRTQPGCDVGETDLPDSLLFCSHHRSWRFFAESVNNVTAFPAVRCDSWLAFQAGACPPADGDVVFLGYAAPATHQTGTFYLRTAAEGPLGLGVDGVVPEHSEQATTASSASQE